MKIVINAIIAKKNAGGAFQISKNFIMETLQHPEIEWYWFVSKDLDEVLSNSFTSMSGKRYFVFPTQPDFRHTYFTVKKELVQILGDISPDVVYSINAPSYFRFKCKEVMRFTKPWVTHPNKYSWGTLTGTKRILKKLEILLQKQLIKKCEYFITQSNTCKNGIIKITGLSDNRIKVVSNVLPAVYRNADNSHLSLDGKWVDVACIGNPYPHKNMDIMPDVLLELKKQGIDNLRFHVTIPKEHPLWSDMKLKLEQNDLQGYIITHGRCTQQELIDVYRHCQLCYQPTVLEVFSASAIEAMYFNLPTVASDMPFNSEVFEDSCLYYEPCNAVQAAKCFKKLIFDTNLQQELKDKMKSRLKVYGNYDSHYKETVDFLIQVAEDRI